MRIGLYHGAGDPLRLLVLLAANGGNIVTTLLIDDSAVQTISLVADSYHDGMALPPHDLVFNAIGDAERADGTLAIAERIADRSSAPFLNRPGAVMQTRRAEVERLNAIPGVTAPHTELLPRTQITPTALAERGFAFPLLLRSPGYHMGEHFTLVATPDDLAANLAALPGDEILAIAYLDARRADGTVRKYRALMIGGRLYPVHLAISRAWKIHYFSADMRDNDDNRAEEARYLSDMRGHFGSARDGGARRHRSAPRPRLRRDRFWPLRRRQRARLRSEPHDGCLPSRRRRTLRVPAPRDHEHRRRGPADVQRAVSLGEDRAVDHREDLRPARHGLRFEVVVKRHVAYERCVQTHHAVRYRLRIVDARETGVVQQVEIGREQRADRSATHLAGSTPRTYRGPAS